MGELKTKVALLAISMILILKCGADDPTFSMNGPKVIREGVDYRFTASGQNLKKPIKVDFKLNGTDEKSRYYEWNIIDEKISSDELEDYVFYTSRLSPGKYSLSASVTDPHTKTNKVLSQDLSFQATVDTILIQTDKAIYQSGDLIRFRVFSFDSETRPRSLDSAIVTILDGNDVVIQSFENVKFVKGKYEGSLQLGNNPSQGSWKIRVEAGVSTIQKNFDVRDYELPTYSVSVDVPSEVAWSDSTFLVVVAAEYTFGEEAVGTAVVTFSRQSYIWWGGPVFDVAMNDVAMKRPGGPGGQQNTVLYTKTIDIDSEKESFIVDIKNDLGINQPTYDNIVVTVDFTEKVTGKTVSSSKNIQIVPYAYSMVFTDDGANTQFTANTEMRVRLTMKKSDGTLAPAGTSVSVRFDRSCWGYPVPACTSVNGTNNYTLDASGSVNLPPFNTKNYDYINYQATSSISQDGYYYAYKQENSVSNALQLKLLTAEPQLGSRVKIQVKATDKKAPDICFCHVFSKQVLLKAKTVEFDEDNIGVLNITPNFENAPTTNIICHYYNADGLIVSGQLTISFRDELNNYLDLDLSSETVKPGANLYMTVGSTINSTVSLTCIDQSVLLLKTGNDFEKEDVFNSLSAYDNLGNDWNWWNQPQDEQPFLQINSFALKWNPPYPRPTGSKTTPKPTPPNNFPGPPLEMERPEADMNNAVGGGVVDKGAGSGAAGSSGPPRTRKNFNETFLWQSVDIIKNKQRGNKIDLVKGEEKVPFTAPDQITTYVCSGVSIHDEAGLGLCEEKPELRVFMPFFIQANVPHHIKRDEVLEMQIVIQNYLNKTQTVNLTISRNDKEFEVLKPDFDGWKVGRDVYWQSFKSVSNQPKGFRLVIRARILGSIGVKIDAVGPVAGDSVLKVIRCDPEGIPKSITQSVLLTKSDSSSNITSSLVCTLPNTAINDTTSTSAAVFGDILGDVFENLEDLIQMSYGCGEQNMLTFVPSIIALIFLDGTGQISPVLKAKAISYALDGYIRELGYRRNDGSFSAFGNDDTSGSTWLTAYVIKSFLMAKPYIAIDQNVIQQGLDYFLSKQNPDGSFREDGRVIHKDMQGGSSNGLPMTAYVSIVLSDLLKEFTDPEYEIARNKSLDFVAANIDLNDVYALAISTYALSRANHSDTKRVADALWAKRIETGDMIRWEKPVTNTQDQENWWWDCQPRSNDIEITSYALFYYVEIDLTISAKIAKYLVSQQSSSGGFGSSQNTVVGIGALAVFSTAFRATVGTMNIHLTPNLGNEFDAQVNPENLFAVQTFVLNPLARQLDVFCGSGSKGTAIVSFTCNFYCLSEETGPRFTITNEFIRPCKNKLLRLRVGIAYIAREGDDESNMVLVEIRLPSGYVYDSDFARDKVIRRLETKEAGTIINVYLDKATVQATVFDVQFVQTCVVTELKPASIVVRDYYDLTKQAQTLFEAPEKLIDCADLPPETTTTTEYPDYFYPGGPIIAIEPVFIDEPVLQNKLLAD